MSKDREYATRLFLNWLNEQHHTAFAPTFEGDVWHAEDASKGEMSIVAAELYEGPDEWHARRAELEKRLDSTRPGSYMMWLPPGADLPPEEPDESEWVRQVVLSASKLASGREGEIRVPVRMMLGKVKDEGGYASVQGGLGRHWTKITAMLNGTFYVDSRALHRFTRDEDERQQLFEHIAMMSQGLQVNDAIEFEHEDAWTVQRLPRAEGLDDGWAITGAPAGFDPNDGALIRRLLRRRLTEATASLKGAPGVKALVLVGAYDYMENENVGPSLRGFDPSLTLPFDVIALVADGDVKPILMSRALRSRIEAPAG